MKSRMIKGVIFGSAVLAVCILSLPWTLPWALGRWRPDVVFRFNESRKEIYLTIDDAPSQATPLILAVLKKHHVPATFFVIGDRVHSDAQLSSIVEAGHLLGHHMRTTARCSTLPMDLFRSDFEYTDLLLRRFAVPRFFRPPSDLGTVEQMTYIKSKGYQPILGTVFPLDHWIYQPASLILLVRWLAVPGGIIILHDGDIRGRTTAQVLDGVLPRLKEAGYEFGRLVPTATNHAARETPAGD